MSENPWAIRGDKEIFACIETHKCAVCGGPIPSKQWHAYIAIQERHFYMHNECFCKLLPDIEAVIRSHTEPTKAEGRTA